MKNATRILLALVVLGMAAPAGAENFYPISSVSSSTAANDFFPVENLILGPGVGYDANVPHDKLIGGANGNWVTAACGFPCDYIETTGMPVITLDLSGDVDLTAISVWGYASDNANGVKDFSLRFATDADGPDGFGTSVTFNPEFNDLPNDDTVRQSFVFTEAVNARYVEFTATDNFFIAPGDGSGGETPGGDRVGLGEIAFPILSVVLGDANGDGVVDFVDFEIIRDNFLTGTTLPEGDVTFDGIVNFDDFGLWKENFTPAAAAVPEPAAGMLLLLASCSLLIPRRFSRRTR